jgi:hypothetical protein
LEFIGLDVMNKVLFAVIAVLLGSAPVMAGVLMELDDQEYTGLARLEYQVGSKSFEVSFNRPHHCYPTDGIESVDGLTLRIGQSLYPLSGAITFGLTEDGLRLSLSSTTGGVTCQGEIIFHDLFVPLGGAE